MFYKYWKNIVNLLILVLLVGCPIVEPSYYAPFPSVGYMYEGRTIINGNRVHIKLSFDTAQFFVKCLEYDGDSAYNDNSNLGWTFMDVIYRWDEKNDSIWFGGTVYFIAIPPYTLTGLYKIFREKNGKVLLVRQNIWLDKLTSIDKTIIEILKEPIKINIPKRRP